FFFSSRRRHTSFSRDWSSDVCSSDLKGLRGFEKSLFNNRPSCSNSIYRSLGRSSEAFEYEAAQSKSNLEVSKCSPLNEKFITFCLSRRAFLLVLSSIPPFVCLRISPTYEFWSASHSISL